MIQRLIFEALRQGMVHIAQDPTILDEIFVDNLGLGAEEVAAIKQLVRDTPPYPVHGYAQRDNTFPLWAILLAGEQEADRYLADDAGIDTEEESDDLGADVTGSTWTHSYLVLNYGLSPAICQYCYEIAKYILITARRDLVNDYGFWNIALSGADLAPDPRYFPEHMFIRQLTVTVSSEYAAAVEGSKLGKAFRVAGIHVDRSGSASDAGPVKTLVTIG